MNEHTETERAPHATLTTRKQQFRRVGASPALYPVVVTIAIAIIGHAVLGFVAHDAERLNIIGAAVFAVLCLIIFELRERSQTARLLSLLERARGDEWLIARLEEFVDNYADVAAIGDRLFLRRAQEYVVNVVGDINDIAEGHIDVQPLQESVFTIRLVDECAHSLAAISMRDERWWASPLGHEYLGRHKAALKRNVRIRRIFVMPLDHLVRAQLMQAMTTQGEIGIDVRAILEESLAPEQRQDLVIYDAKYVRWGAAGEPRRARLSRNSDDIAEATDLFEDAWLRSSSAADFVASSSLDARPEPDPSAPL